MAHCCSVLRLLPLYMPPRYATNHQHRYAAVIEGRCHTSVCYAVFHIIRFCAAMSRLLAYRYAGAMPCFAAIRQCGVAISVIPIAVNHSLTSAACAAIRPIIMLSLALTPLRHHIYACCGRHEKATNISSYVYITGEPRRQHHRICCFTPHHHTPPSFSTLPRCQGAAVIP